MPSVSREIHPSLAGCTVLLWSKYLDVFLNWEGSTWRDKYRYNGCEGKKKTTEQRSHAAARQLSTIAPHRNRGEQEGTGKYGTMQKREGQVERAD